MDRLCARCKQPKTADEFYREHNSWCRECVKAYARARRPRKRPVLPDGQRRCARCKEIKPTEQFVPRSKGGWSSYCRPCWNADAEERRKRTVKNPRGKLGTGWASWRTTGRKCCPVCGEEKPITEFDWEKRWQRPTGWCKPCSRENHNRWIRTAAGRAAQKRDGKKRYQDPKWAARHLTFAAIKLGLLVRRPCEVCGVTKVQAHHTDYGKPLEVRWLCALHHSQLHQKEA